MRGASLVWVASMAMITSCILVTPPMPTGKKSDTPWLPFLLMDSHAVLSPLASPHEDDISSRSKKVFLSRGWGPGGYDAPPPPAPQRFVRRPLLPSSLRQANTETPVLPPLTLRGKAQKLLCFMVLLNYLYFL